MKSTEACSMSKTVRITFAAVALAVLVFVGDCVARGEQKTLTADQAQVANAVSAVFDAANHDDLAKFHSVVSPEFYLFDAGARFDGDTIMTLIKSDHAKGRRYEWNVTEPDVHVIGDTAWIAYVNRGSVTDESGTTTAQRWLESAFLRRRGGVWKVEFMHSTHVPTAPPPSSASN